MTITERQRDFAALLKNEQFRREFFNQDFFEALRKRRQKFKDRGQKIQIVQSSIALFLGLAVLSIHIPISFLGLSISDARDLREVLLIISSSIQLLEIFPRLEDEQAREMLQAHVDELSAGNKSVLRALRLRYGLGGESFPENVDVSKLTKRNVVAVLSAGIGLLGWLLVVIIALLAVQIITCVDVIAHPTVSLRFSMLVVGYVVLADLAGLGMSGITKLPSKDTV